MMNPWKLATLVLSGAVLTGALVTTIKPAQADDQPNMRAAVVSLDQAKTLLERATADKGGHRVKALQLTKEALEETKKGIAFDDRQH